MRNVFLKEVRLLITHYNNNKKKVFIAILLSLFFLLLTMVINGFKVLYPYHFIVSLPFLILAVGYFFSAFLFDKKTVVQSSSFRLTKKVFIEHKGTTFVVILSCVFLYIFYKVAPNDINPFAHLTEEELVLYIEDSVHASVILLDNIESSGNDLLDSGLLQKDSLSGDELVVVTTKWNQFLQAAVESENMTDVHRYFSKISLFRKPDLHMKSFVISYSLYMKKFEMFAKITHAVGNNERVIKSLNEYSSVFGGKNSYFDIRDRHVSHETFLRRNLGRFYLVFLNTFVTSEPFSEEYKMLVRESVESHNYIVTMFPTTAATFVFDMKSDVENTLFRSWFPIQKNVANTLGNILVSSRKETFITVDQVQEMKKSLSPGDILIERRNWHASNVGIPGFWPHAALYVGSIDDANEFFKEVFPFAGYSQFSKLVEAEYPDLYEKYTQKDDQGYAYSVIEGQAPGIILQSLEKSAKADYVGVLRPKLEKIDILQAVLRSFENYKKPYDYNFDFETRDELVCSELVYDAYLPMDGKRGVNFPLTVTSGRKMISPNDMVKKFFNERGTDQEELSFVYFIDGNESLSRAFVKDENAFSTSWTRPKFSKLQE